MSCSGILLKKSAFIAGIFLMAFSVSPVKSNAQESDPCQLKDVPVISFSNLSPPYRNYAYFEGIEQFAFQSNATTFSLVNAWWLAEISTLVFADENFVKKRLKKAGLSNVLYFDKQSTQCYAANNDRFAVIAFRGSDIWAKKEKVDVKKSIADIRADLDIRMVDWRQGGKVHRGFKEALDEVWTDLQPHIERYQTLGLPIWITGHSLGGALATLCSSLVGTVQGVYTFGSPRVGNEAFRDHLRVKLYRIVNNADIVSRVPLKHTYTHVGELKFIDAEGAIGDVMINTLKPIGDPDDVSVGQDFANRPERPFKGFVPAPIRDHVPLLFAIHLWNNLIESQKGESPCTKE